MLPDGLRGKRIEVSGQQVTNAKARGWAPFVAELKERDIEIVERVE